MPDPYRVPDQRSEPYADEEYVSDEDRHTGDDDIARADEDHETRVSWEMMDRDIERERNQ